MLAKSGFKVAQWNQLDLEGYASPGMSLARASVIFEADGDIAGTFNVEYVIHSMDAATGDRHDAQATYVGYMEFAGSIGGKSGFFTLEDKGVYADSAPASVLAIKPGTGVGDFKGISGGGKYYNGEGGMIIEIDYSIS